MSCPKKKTSQASFSTQCKTVPFKWYNDIMSYKYMKLVNSMQNSSCQVDDVGNVQPAFFLSYPDRRGWRVKSSVKCSIRVFFHARIVLILELKNNLKTSFEVPLCRRRALQAASALDTLSTVPETHGTMISCLKKTSRASFSTQCKTVPVKWMMWEMFDRNFFHTRIVMMWKNVRSNVQSVVSFIPGWSWF